MANFKNYEQDPNKKNAGMGGSTILAGNAAKSPAGQQQGTGWTNLQTYLDGNKGAGEGMANDITKDTNNQITANDDQTNQWSTAAKTGVDDATKKNVYGATFDNGTAKDVAGIDENNYAAWKALPNYTGAKTAQATEGWNSLYTNTQNTKDKIANLNSYEGQKSALSDTYGKSGNYSNGFGTLDAFLLRGDKSGQQALSTFQDQNKNYGDKFNTATSDVNNYIQGAEGRGAANKAASDTSMRNRYGALNQKGFAARDADNGGYEQAVGQVNQRYNDKGYQAGTISPYTGKFISNAGQYVTQTAGDSNAYLDSDENAALSKIEGIDDDASSNYKGVGKRATSTVDYSRLDADINNLITSQKRQEEEYIRNLRAGV